MSGKVKDFSEETKDFLKRFGFDDEDDIKKGFKDYIQEEYGCDVATLIRKIAKENK